MQTETQPEDMLATISFKEWLELKSQRDQLYEALTGIIEYDDEAIEEGGQSRLSQGEYDKAVIALSMARGEVEVPSPAVRKALRRFWRKLRERESYSTIFDKFDQLGAALAELSFDHVQLGMTRKADGSLWYYSVDLQNRRDGESIYIGHGLDWETAKPSTALAQALTEAETREPA